MAETLPSVSSSPNFVGTHTHTHAHAHAHTHMHMHAHTHTHLTHTHTHACTHTPDTRTHTHRHTDTHTHTHTQEQVTAVWKQLARNINHKGLEMQKLIWTVSVCLLTKGPFCLFELAQIVWVTGPLLSHYTPWYDCNLRALPSRGQLKSPAVCALFASKCNINRDNKKKTEKTLETL